MKKSKSSTSAADSSAKKRVPAPFATPPHPLGYNYIPERRPLRASTFASILPSVIAKYGLGRKLGVERFHESWRAALEAVFGGDGASDFESAVGAPDKLALFTRYTRPSSFRGGVLRVEVVSNLLYQELQFHLDDLRRAMVALLPDEKIREIKIVVR